MKVLTILGTRPEAIQLSRTLAKLDMVCESVVVHTGQNSDPNLYDVFFRDLRMRQPDYYLNSRNDSLAIMLSDIFQSIERILDEEQPDAVLILGDTNSGLAAIIAERKGYPVFHIEAGNRSFDANVPEEKNRRVIDHISSINMVYTEHARRNLLDEGLHPRRIYLVGSPLREVLDYYAEDIAESKILEELNLEPQRYFLLSLHRQENVDNAERLLSLLSGAEQISQAYDLPVIMSTHPRTRSKLEHVTSDIIFCEPFGYFDYIALQQNAKCVISDSGTIAVEAAMLGFPAVTPRDSIERAEAIDTGAIVLAGATPDGMIDAVATVLRNGPGEIPAEYEIRNTSTRVVNIIMGLNKLSGLWDGLR